MSKEHCVVVMVELDAEGQGVVVASYLLLDRVLVVADVLSCSLPSSSIDLGVFLRVDQGLHPMVIKTIWLQQVDDVESIRPPSPCILQPKVEPLAVCFC